MQGHAYSSRNAALLTTFNLIAVGNDTKSNSKELLSAAMFPAADKLHFCLAKQQPLVAVVHHSGDDKHERPGALGPPVARTIISSDDSSDMMTNTTI